MKYNIVLILVSIVWLQCGQRQTTEAVSSDSPRTLQRVKEQPRRETFDCMNGTMTEAWHGRGQDEALPAVDGLDEGFVILVDSRLEARNFVSSYERFLREQSVAPDTARLARDDEWRTLGPQQKLRKIRETKQRYRYLADSIHHANNQGHQQVWIINNTTDTISVQMQDGSYICILQALTKGGEWYPIEYWQTSGCGNSYYLKSFPPQTANSFIIEVRTEGDYATKLRYKLLGKDRYHYSNEFEGSVDYCNFVMDSTMLGNDDGPRSSYLELDSVWNLALP